MTTITKFRKLNDVGSLANAPPPTLPQFRKYNLIYGFNGSGKTTLSRMLSSLETGEVSRELPPGSAFEIELSDGKVLKSHEDLSALKGRVLVFNADFQEKNLQWKAGTARPVFIVGEEQAKNVNLLELAIQRRIGLLAAKAQAHEFSVKAADSFATYKRDAARKIAENLGLGRKYIATNLEADTLAYAGCEQTQEEVTRLQSVVAQEAPLPKLPLLQPIRVKASAGISKAIEVSQETIGQLKINDLNNHPQMLGWVSQGLSYHRSKNLQTCLFCGNDLSEQRLSDLSSFVNDRFEIFSSRINEIKTALKSDEELPKRIVLPSQNDLSPSVRLKYLYAKLDIEAGFKRINEVAADGIRALDEKLNSLSARREYVPIYSVSEVEAIERSIAERCEQINSLIRKHNEEFDAFGSVKAHASDSLRKHYVCSGHEAFEKFGKECADAEAALVAKDREVRAIEQEIERLQREVRAHGPAAEIISRYLQAYLGRSDLDISPINNGYELRRNGRVISGPLSEGEKTAIALCYFLSTVKAESRKLKESIVVVDDPVSSLDTKALNYSFNFIRSALSGAGQLIILTHNLAYMNQVKKWLKNKSRKEKDKEPTAALLFLDMQKTEAGGSVSNLVELPKHIRDYDSEYQYLFNLARAVASKPIEEIGGYVYVMPNALRKLLEVFLAFKLPGADGLGSKVAALANKPNLGLDPARILAIDSLVQVESHADDLEDLVAFSSMTVEEIKDAAQALLHLMEKVDGEHYTRLCSACS